MHLSKLNKPYLKHGCIYVNYTAMKMILKEKKESVKEVDLFFFFFFKYFFLYLVAPGLSCSRRAP